MEPDYALESLRSLETILEVTSSTYTSNHQRTLSLDPIFDVYERCVYSYSHLNRSDQEKFCLLSARIRELSGSLADQKKIKSVVGHFFHFTRQAIPPLWLTDSQIDSFTFLKGLADFTAGVKPSLLEIDPPTIPGYKDDSSFSKFLKLLTNRNNLNEQENLEDLFSWFQLALFFDIPKLLISLTRPLTAKLYPLTEKEASKLRLANKEIVTIASCQIDNLEDVEARIHLQNLLRDNPKTALTLGLAILSKTPECRGKYFGVILASHLTEESFVLYRFLMNIGPTFPVHVNRTNLNQFLEFDKLFSGDNSPSIALTYDEEKDKIPLTSSSKEEPLSLPDTLRERVAYFSIQNCRYENFVNLALCRLRNLKYLDFSEYRNSYLYSLSGLGNTFPQLPHLERFSPPRQFSASFLAHILLAAPHFEHLDLSSYEYLEGDWPRQIALRLSKLKQFSPPKYLTGSALFGILAAAPQYTEDLIDLDLSHCEAISEGNSTSSQITLPNLQRFSPPKRMPVSTLVDILTSAHQYRERLVHLNLSTCQEISDEWPDTNLSLPFLQSFSPPQNFTASMLVGILSAAPQLTKRILYLDLSSCSSISGEWSTSPQVQLTSLEGFFPPRKLAASTLAGILMAAPQYAQKLVHLDLSLSERIFGILPEQNSLSLPSLQRLSPPKRITDSAFFSILEAAPQYTQSVDHLDFSSCEKIDDEGSHNFQLKLPNLMRFSPPTDYCSVSFFASILEAATQYSESLEILDLSTCLKLDGSWPEKTSFRLPNLRQFIPSTALPALVLGNILNCAPHYLQSLECLDLSHVKELEGDWPENLTFSFSNVRRISSPQSIYASTLCYILSKCPMLENIEWHSELRVSGDESEEIHFELLNLRSFTAHDSLNFSLIVKILAAATNLEVLDLSNCDYIYEELPENLTLPSLKRLLTPKNFDSDFLNTILSSSVNLEILDLSNSTRISEVESKKPHSQLSKLRCIVLPEDISSSFLNYILAHAPNLECLDLSSCKRISKSFYETENSLPPLPHLNQIIAPECLELSCLIDLLSIAPLYAQSIKHLDLSRFDHWEKWPEHSSLQLPSLQHVTFPKVVDISLIHGIFTAATNYANGLEYLDLSIYQMLHGEWPANSTLQLPNVRQIFFPQWVDSSLIIGILTAAPYFTNNLECLDLSSSRSMEGEWPKTTSLVLPKLKRFLAPRSMQTSLLASFLAITPRLEELDLAFCVCISGEWPDHLSVHLPDLKSFTASKELRTSFLLRILAAAPNLEFLDLSSCDHLDSPAPEDFAFPNLKKFSSPKNINDQLLKRILKASENLEHLDVSHLEINEEDWAYEDFPKLPNLRIFHPPKSKLTSFFLNIFAMAPNLESLNLSSADVWSDVWLSRNGTPLSSLKHFSSPKGIYISTFFRILAAAPNLEYLDMSSCEEAYEDGPYPTEIQLPNLRKISSPQAVPLPFLFRILAIAPNLEHLDLSPFRGLDSTRFFNIQCSISNLRSFSAPKKIHRDSLALIFKAAPNLEYCDFSSCEEILEHDPDSTRSMLSNLKVIALSYKAHTSIERFCQQLQQTSSNRPMMIRH